MAIHKACKDGDYDQAKELLDADATIVNEPDGSGNTPLHCAAAYGRVKIAALLIERGADVALRNPGGKTAAEIAEFNGYLDLAKRLRKGDFPASDGLPDQRGSAVATQIGITGTSISTAPLENTERSIYNPQATIVSKRYYGLRTVSAVLKIFGYIFILAGLVAACMILQVEAFGDMKPVLAIAAVACGLFYGVIAIAVGESTVVFADIEENTRAARESSGKSGG